MTSLHPAQIDDNALLDRARQVLAIEADAVQHLRDTLDESFCRACRQVLACQGRVIVSGMGKSGHIARKIAATLASTGTRPSSCTRPKPATAIWAWSRHRTCSSRCPTPAAPTS